MFDTQVTIIGNVLNNPVFRRVRDNSVLVANFKVATTARRYDRATDSWVDGQSLRVRVNCWRRLAETVGLCVHIGDPVIVTGRLYSRDWDGDDNVRRTSYELEAFTVGHDLNRGVDKFTRHRSNLGTTTVDDAETDGRVAGEPSEPVDELNNRVHSRVFDRELGGYVNAVEFDPNDFDSEEELEDGLTADDEDFLDDAARLGDEDAEETEDSEPDGDPDETPRPKRRRKEKEPVGV